MGRLPSEAKRATRRAEQVRASRTVVFSRQGSEIAAFNFLSGKSFACSPDLIDFLGAFGAWLDVASAAKLVPGATKTEAISAVDSLVDATALVSRDSALAVAEDEYCEKWRWGLPAALFHFSLRDRDVMSIEQGEAVQRARIVEAPQPPLYQRCDDTSSVSLPSAVAGNELLELMSRRRTIRETDGRPVTLKELSDCLFAGLGITGTTRNCVGDLPLSMTPSGGARNPFEAFVYARQVDGLEAGFHHYSAFDHALSPIRTNERPMPSELLGGQEWTDAMPCLILLCARFERTMWKYDDANAYRVVLIEAGHIGQNVMLAATQHGLTACPSAALNHSRINACIGDRNSMTHAPIYALALGRTGCSRPVPTC